MINDYEVYTLFILRRILGCASSPTFLRHILGCASSPTFLRLSFAYPLSRPKNGLQLFCQFNLCFSFFKLSIVSKNSFTTSV